MILDYSKNLNLRFLIALLKAHGIKRIVISPDNTEMKLVAGLWRDEGFEIYLSVDGRSAAYMACGIATESGEPIVITCAEAISSRDYFPGLTEGYYRKLPILVVTGEYCYYQVGYLKHQTIDRSISPKDVFVHKEQLPIIRDQVDEKESQLRINRAILALTRHGGGPVHIDIPHCYNDYDFSIKELPPVQCIKRYSYRESLPKLPKGRIVVFIGAHPTFNDETTNAIDLFCTRNNAVVFHDHSSGYNGNTGVRLSLLSIQSASYNVLKNIELIIHLGESVADWFTMQKLRTAKRVWRISPDGELCNTFGMLEATFELNEVDFFRYYNSDDRKGEDFFYLDECRNSISSIHVPVNNLPFSNFYAAAIITRNFPSDAVVHLGPDKTVRAWSMFTFPDTVVSTYNAGGHCIDGVLSSCIGASLICSERIYYCVLGVSTFFYDMNVLGNRFLGKNVRILLINNNGGNIYKQDTASVHKYLGDKETNKYRVIAGNLKNRSNDIVKHFAEDLGLEYLSASSKAEFEEVYKHFLDREMTNNSMLFELFTDDEDEQEAFKIIFSLDTSTEEYAKQLAKYL